MNADYYIPSQQPQKQYPMAATSTMNVERMYPTLEGVGPSTDFEGYNNKPRRAPHGPRRPPFFQVKKYATIVIGVLELIGAAYTVLYYATLRNMGPLLRARLAADDVGPLSYCLSQGDELIEQFRLLLLLLFAIVSLIFVAGMVGVYREHLLLTSFFLFIIGLALLRGVAETILSDDSPSTAHGQQQQLQQLGPSACFHLVLSESIDNMAGVNKNKNGNSGSNSIRLVSYSINSTTGMIKVVPHCTGFECFSNLNNNSSSNAKPKVVNYSTSSRSSSKGDNGLALWLLAIQTALLAWYWWDLIKLRKWRQRAEAAANVNEGRLENSNYPRQQQQNWGSSNNKNTFRMDKV